jgi:hypothetical protein
MIIEVVVGAVLIFLGLCALLGLPALSLHLQRQAERTHALEKEVIADVRADLHEAERKVAHVFDDDVGPERSIGGLPEANDVYHS